MNFKIIIKLKEIVSSVKFWIILLLILLVGFNVLVFHIYRMSHPSETLSAQLWVYFGSDAFKIITASIILPFLLCLFELLFDIRKTNDERIRRDDEKRKERIQRYKEELKEKQWECIENTSQTWNQLFALVSEVRYFEKEANKGARIEDIRLKLDKFISPAEDMVNMWYFRFFRIFSEKGTEFLFSWDNIDKKDSVRFLMYLRDYQGIRLTDNAEISKSDDSETIYISNLEDENSAKIVIKKEEEYATLRIGDGITHDLKVKKENDKYYIGSFMEDIEILFLVPFNVLLSSTHTVAHIIQGNNKKDDIQELQNSLELIQEGINQMAHHPIINILKYSMNLADGGETATEAKKGIQDNITALKRMSGWLTEIEKKYKKPFPSMEGNEVKVFREEFEKAENENHRNVEKLKNLFCKIPSQKRTHIKEVSYSPEYIRRLADEMCFYLILNDLKGLNFSDYKFYELLLGCS